MSIGSRKSKATCARALAVSAKQATHSPNAVRLPRQRGLAVPQPFSFSPEPPPRFRMDWTSWTVIVTVLLLLAAFVLYFYAG